MRPLAMLELQRGHLFPWVPVMLACGIGLYFALRLEPSMLAYMACGALVVLCAGSATWISSRAAPVFLACALIAGGVLIAGARAHSVAAPVLEYRFYGGVEGRVIKVDRSHSDVPRLTLDQVWMERTPPARIPAKVRISLHGTQGFIDPKPGMRVMTTANLSPPSPPSEPYGFDFQRRAWFDGLGAVGYARVPVLALPADGFSRFDLLIARTRSALSAGIQSRVSGDEGAFAVAILTGDRSAMSRETLQTLRDSNLAHLLAISGLHMALLTGFVFAAVRFLLALIPPLVLRISTKKIAAVIGLGAGAVYLALSGGNVATERAFVMVAVMLCAVLLDRRAITLRAVALAAVIILLLEPESLTEPGFQMSFAATTALVVIFRALQDMPAGRWTPPRWAMPVLTLVLSSAVAGAATAPIAAAHFNQIAQYGLLANVLTVPLMGALIIPAAVIAALLVPFGLEALALIPMQWGISWILAVAKWVASLDGAVWYVPAPGPGVLPLLAIGGVWVMAWQGRLRWGGVAPLAVALVLWSQVERPALLIAQSGGLVGVMTPDGRTLNKAKGEGFVARSWLENDGDNALQPEAFARHGVIREAGYLRSTIAQVPFIHVSGRGWEQRLHDNCVDGFIIVPQKLENMPKGPCHVLDRTALAESGALAVYERANGPQLLSVKEVTGQRLWSSQ